MSDSHLKELATPDAPTNRLWEVRLISKTETYSNQVHSDTFFLRSHRLCSEYLSAVQTRQLPSHRPTDYGEHQHPVWCGKS